MYIDGQQGAGHEDVIARLYSAQQAGDSTECVMFFYNLKGGGISAMSIISQDQQDVETVVWQLPTVQDTGEWKIGQVPVAAARRIIFQVEKAEGVDAGFAAVDEILCLHVDECLYNAPEAAPRGSTTTSKAPPGGELPDCDFEVSQCGWTSAVELNNTQFFYFARSQGRFHSDGFSGPQADHYNSSEGFSSILLISLNSVFISGYFLLALALDGKQGMDTELASPLLTGEKDICFNFWFDISQSANEIEKVDICIESSRDLTRIKVWQLKPINLGESWQQGRLQLAGLAHEEYKVHIKITLESN